ncbi:MAG: hypothetical protein U5L72_17855 [Bacteroidales bacterium]|nr:hypothetical protein [Bacteroidales bacterium]
MEQLVKVFCKPPGTQGKNIPIFPNPSSTTMFPTVKHLQSLRMWRKVIIDENKEYGPSGYTFKNVLQGKARILKAIRIYGQVFNAYVFTKYSGSDPEVSTNTDSNLAPGIDRNTAPQARI